MPDHSIDTAIDISGIAEQYTCSEVIDYFAEVALSSEYYEGAPAGAAVVRKWTKPIIYCLRGDFSNEDAQLIKDFYDTLAQLAPTFPGAVRTDNTGAANLTIHFLPRSAFREQMGQYVEHESANGCVVFWYGTGDAGADSAGNVGGKYSIETELIGLNSSMNSSIRQAVILQELYNGLGLINDTSKRVDSIIYQNAADSRELSAMDWYLAQLLYSDDVKCGMGYEECAEVIERQ